MKPISTVLAVDDEPKALLLLRNLIEPEGYRILLASGGAQALELAAKEHPDVVLLDVMMPEMDGFEVCRRMRADPFLAQLPIIMLTALDDRESRLRGLEIGADDFLSKPFDSLELRTRVRTIIRLNRFRHLYEQGARFEAAITHSPDGTVLAELDGTIIHRNPRFTALIDPAQPVQGNFFAYLPDEFGLKTRAHLASNPSFHLGGEETSLNFAKKIIRTVEVSHGLIPWEGRRIVLYTIRDITERKLLEQQLYLSQRIELLGQLAGSAIHDVNNILFGISGSAQILEMKGGEDLSLHLGQIITSTQRGASILRQLLMFTRGEDADLQPADPAIVAAEVANLVKESFGKTYAVDFHTATELPQVLADPTQIHQIVMNLCVNGRDAMPHGGSLAITLERWNVEAEIKGVVGGVRPAPGVYVAISIRDNGTGIPPEVLPKLFDPFFSTKPKDKGTGLGLATVSRIMQRHKGFITLDTEVGKGTCFTCYFPVVPAARS